MLCIQLVYSWDTTLSYSDWKNTMNLKDIQLTFLAKDAHWHG